MKAAPLLLALGLLLVGAASQTDPNLFLPSLQLTRQDRVITVQQTADDSEGGLFVSSRGCAGEGIGTFTVYAPQPKLVETTVNEVRITSPIVLREQQGSDQETAVLEIFGGTLELDEETLCPENIERSESADVTLYEGRTTVRGRDLTYNNATGIGDMQGPIELERAAEEDSPALNASSDSLELDIDRDITVLRGNVRVESEGRVSEADEFEFDEASGFAVLRGSPARSTEGDRTVSASLITYDLNTNDVVAEGAIGGSFEYTPEGGEAIPVLTPTEDLTPLEPETPPSNP